MGFRKRSGANTQPCLTQVSTGNHSESYASTHYTAKGVGIKYLEQVNYLRRKATTG